jgi:REP-associated tyrosine transposase
MSRPRRISGFDYLGPYCYFLTFCTFERRKVFHDARISALVVAQFQRAARETGFALLAYCLMPDHAHLLVEGTADGSHVRRFSKRAKQFSGQACRRVTNVRLWQEGYYDRVVRKGDDVKAIARYILENPVRAGLVRTPLEYPHLGSGRWTIQELIESAM